MAKHRTDLSAFVGKLLEEQDGEVLREGIRVLSQALMETEVAGLIGADRHEPTPERKGLHNGYRMRTWNTRVGTIELVIPKVDVGGVADFGRRRSIGYHLGLRSVWKRAHSGPHLRRPTDVTAPQVYPPVTTDRAL